MAIPDNINRLIVMTKYPDLASLGWFEPSEKIIFKENWNEIIKILDKPHGISKKVAVYPNADIYYFG